ncbi:MAG: ammonium transporter [Chloroflexota bacterium]
MDALNAGDNAFVMISAALVMLMTPGLAMFYGGMVRAKNALGTIMQSFFIVGVISLLWAVIGYSLAFGSDIGGLIGGLNWVGLAGVGQEPFTDYAPTVSHLSFMVFQCMFAVITPALITGAFAERMKFSAFLVFTIAWSLLVYSPVAHWVWGVGGWIRTLGALDFAGGTVVHINAAAAALAAAVVIGKRRGLGSPALSPHNLPLTVMGAALLWFGWFGFNAGSALGANGLAASAFVVTHLAASAAAVSWVAVEWAHRGKPTTLGAVSGAVGGLVAITPAAGFVEPMPAIIIGLLAGLVCYGAVLLKWRLGYDDSLDAVGVHGAGGITGALCTGLFATTSVNAAGANGLFYGNPGLLGTQLIAVLATLAYSLVVSLVLLKVIDAWIGLRVKPEEEEAGLDLSQHSESAYTI